MEKILIVDGDLIMHKHLHTNQRELMTSDGRLSGLFYGVLKSLSLICDEFAPTAVMLALSGGTCKWRQEIWADYKKRSKKEQELHNTVQKGHQYSNHDIISQNSKWIRQYIGAFGINVVSVPGYEADDVAFVLADFIQNKVSTPTEITLVSDDWDWAQMANYGVEVYRPHSEMYLEATNFEDLVGFRPDEYIYFKATQGDKSDKIPSVARGLGEATCIKLFDAVREEFGEFSLDNLKKRAEKSNKNACKNLIQDWDKYKRNLDLMMYENVPQDEIINYFKQMDFTRFNESEAQKVIESFEFKKLYGLLNEPTFKRL